MVLAQLKVVRERNVPIKSCMCGDASCACVVVLRNTTSNLVAKPTVNPLTNSSVRILRMAFAHPFRNVFGRLLPTKSSFSVGRL